MAYRQEEYVAEIVAESGVLKGRKPWQREARRDEATVVERLGRTCCTATPSCRRSKPTSLSRTANECR